MNPERINEKLDQVIDKISSFATSISSIGDVVEGTEQEWKQKHSLEVRKAEAMRVRSRYPHLVPVIVSRANKETPMIDKRKFLVPKDLLSLQLAYVIRRRCRLAPDQALFYFLTEHKPNGSTAHVMMPSTSLAEIDKPDGPYRDIDNFIYVLVNCDSSFGYSNE